MACERGDVVGDVCMSSFLNVFGGGVMGMWFIVVVVVIVVVISVGMFGSWFVVARLPQLLVGPLVVDF
jgi:hypothetical protein